MRSEQYYLIGLVQGDREYDFTVERPVMESALPVELRSMVPALTLPQVRAAAEVAYTTLTAPARPASRAVSTAQMVRSVGYIFAGESYENSRNYALQAAYEMAIDSDDPRTKVASFTLLTLSLCGEISPSLERFKQVTELVRAQHGNRPVGFALEMDLALTWLKRQRIHSGWGLDGALVSKMRTSSPGHSFRIAASLGLTTFRMRPLREVIESSVLLSPSEIISRPLEHLYIPQWDVVFGTPAIEYAEGEGDDSVSLGSEEW